MSCLQPGGLVALQADETTTLEARAIQAPKCMSRPYASDLFGAYLGDCPRPPPAPPVPPTGRTLLPCSRCPALGPTLPALADSEPSGATSMNGHHRALASTSSSKTSGTTASAISCPLRPLTPPAARPQPQNGRCYRRT
jgi:hypothetical protein